MKHCLSCLISYITPPEGKKRGPGNEIDVYVVEMLWAGAGQRTDERYRSLFKAIKLISNTF